MHETGKNTIFGLGPGLAKHIIQIFIHRTAMNIYRFLERSAGTDYLLFILKNTVYTGML